MIKSEKVKRTVLMDVMLFIVVATISLGLILIQNFYREKVEEFRNKYNITLISINGERWGVFATDPNFKNHPDAMTDVFDINGNRREMNRDRELRIPTFDVEGLVTVDDNLSLEERKSQDGKFHNEVIERRALINQALKADKRLTLTVDVVSVIEVILIGGYFLYIIFQLIILITRIIKTYGINTILTEVKKRFVVLFSKEVLIRIILILGIIYLGILILKSCDFI